MDKSLWYTAPLSRHTLPEQFTKRSREMGLPWDAVLHSTRHSPNGFWSGRCGCVYNTRDPGHASVTTSQRYVHPVPETIQLAVTRLEQYRKAEAAAQRPSLAVVPKTKRPATLQRRKLWQW